MISQRVFIQRGRGKDEIGGSRQNQSQMIKEETCLFKARKVELFPTSPEVLFLVAGEGSDFSTDCVTSFLHQIFFKLGRKTPLFISSVLGVRALQ